MAAAQARSAESPDGTVMPRSVMVPRSKATPSESVTRWAATCSRSRVKSSAGRCSSASSRLT